MTARIALGVALAALLLSTAGTGYAVTKLKAKSVGARELKRGAVRSVAVRDGSLRAADLGAAARAQLRGAGPQGPVGPAGPAGPKGETGPAGAPGAAAFVTTLSADAAHFAPNLPANAPLAPASCRTATHVAGPSEVALVHAVVSVFPTGAANAAVYNAVGVSQNGGAFAQTGAQQMESMQDGIASSSATTRIPLVAGTSYRFGAVIESSSAVNLFKSACQVVVTVAHEDDV